MNALFLAISLLSAATVAVKDRRMGATVVLLAQFALPTIGFFLLDLSDGPVTDGWLVLAAPALFTLGVLFSKSLVQPDPELKPASWLGVFLRHSFVILAALAVLQFASTGVTLFDPTVETSRFNIGSSGMGGFPSRAVLYAIPALALLSLATLSKETRRITTCIWVLYSVSQAALGFKGALIEVLITGALGYFINVGKPRRSHLILFTIGFASALVYVQFVGAKYGTLAESGTSLTYIVNRSTTGAIQAGHTALGIRPTVTLEGGSVLLNDLKILVARYSGASSAHGYTFDSLMSSVVTGTPLQSSKFLVPVTVGGAVYLIYSVAVPAVIFILILLGVVWSKMIRVVRAPSNVVAASVAAVTLNGIRVFLMNGEGAYLIINLAFTIMLMCFCALPYFFLAKFRRPMFGPVHKVFLNYRGRS